MKVNLKVKMKVTIEFLVEIYSRNDLHFFEKYYTWKNIQPSWDFLDTLYIQHEDNCYLQLTCKWLNVLITLPTIEPTSSLAFIKAVLYPIS